MSRSRVQRLIEDGCVTVNGERFPNRHILTPGDVVTVDRPAFSSLPPADADSVPILFEDDDIIVVDKPAGLVVHPAGPHRTDTLIQRLWPKLAGAWAPDGRPVTDRPGVVHRLDRGTSGVMVIAKNPAAAENLSRQFADRVVKKTYYALVEGLMDTPSGKVRSVVGRSREQPHRMSTTSPGRWSETEWTVIKTFPKTGLSGQTLLEVNPRTGRTHQIRVQLSALGHPIVGDKVYGGTPGPRPLLHAHRLEFLHPRTQKLQVFISPAVPF